MSCHVSLAYFLSVLFFFFLLQFAGTLSDGLGKTMDTRHQAERESIRYQAVTSGEHLVAGIQGLAHGMREAVSVNG